MVASAWSFASVPASLGVGMPFVVRTQLMASLVRSYSDEADRADVSTFENLYVGSGSNKVPLDSIATIITSWQPAAISRFNRRRAIIAGGQIEDGLLATAVSSAALPRMQALLDELPQGYELQELGETSETKKSRPLNEAVERAGKARMKPSVLTTLTTVGGMFPLALFGGPMWAGMSYAMIFGLLFSTALTLLVVPAIYVAFVDWFGVKVTPEVEQ